MQRRWIIAVALCLPSIVGLSSNCGSVADHGPQHGERLDARGGHGVPRRDGVDHRTGGVADRQFVPRIG